MPDVLGAGAWWGAWGERPELKKSASDCSGRVPEGCWPDASVAPVTHALGSCDLHNCTSSSLMPQNDACDPSYSWS